MAQETPAQRLKRMRLDAGLSQRELSEATGVDEPVIQRAETGSRPRPKSAAALAAYFDLKASDLWPIS